MSPMWAVNWGKHAKLQKEDEAIVERALKQAAAGETMSIEEKVAMCFSRRKSLNVYSLESQTGY